MGRFLEHVPVIYKKTGTWEGIFVGGIMNICIKKSAGYSP